MRDFKSNIKKYFWAIVYINIKLKLCVNCIQAEDSLGSGSIARLELGYLEEERVRVLAKVDELKARITELEQQLQESKQEVSCSHKHFDIVKYTEGYTGSPHLIIVDKSLKQRQVMRSGTENVRWSSRVFLCGLWENCSSDMLICTGGDGKSSATGRETGRAGANRGRGRDCQPAAAQTQWTGEHHPERERQGKIHTPHKRSQNEIVHIQNTLMH